jgi:hypothetical protein
MQAPYLAWFPSRRPSERGWPVTASDGSIGGRPFCRWRGNPPVRSSLGVSPGGDLREVAFATAVKCPTRPGLVRSRQLADSASPAADRSCAVIPAGPLDRVQRRRRRTDRPGSTRRGSNGTCCRRRPPIRSCPIGALGELGLKAPARQRSALEHGDDRRPGLSGPGRCLDRGRRIATARSGRSSGCTSPPGHDPAALRCLASSARSRTGPLYSATSQGQDGHNRHGRSASVLRSLRRT